MKTVKDILHKLNYVFTSRQKRLFFVVMLVSFIGSIWELLGVTAILPFIEAVMTPDNLGNKWYFVAISDLFHPDDNLELLTILGVFIVIIYVVKNIYLMFSSYVQTWYSTNIQRDLSIRLNRIYIRSSYLFHLGINSSILIRSINHDVGGVFCVCFYAFRGIAEVFTVVAVSAYIVFLDPILSISLVGLLGVCMMALVFGLRKLIKRFGQTAQRTESDMFKYLSQTYNGIKEIMVMKRQNHFAKSFDKSCVENASVLKRNTFLNNVSQYIYEMVCIGGLIIVVVIRLHMESDIAFYVTRLAIVAVAAFRLFPSVGRLTTNINAVMYNKPRLDAVYDMMKTAKQEEMYQLNIASEEKQEKNEELVFDNELKIDNITWKYPTGTAPVLKELNMSIKKGQSVAFVGPSGAGKTTLADVILGLLKPQEGHVLLDGKDVYDNLWSWSKIVGYVPQSVFLTDDSVRNNVAFGIDADQIDEEKVWQALREAQLEEFVKGLPEGLDTFVGEGGTLISGGQRQLIAIARALYQNPMILVLDEATSALDNETEAAVMDAIDSLHGSKTMIIVAHRLSTIQNCDVIYEINNGVAHLRDSIENIYYSEPGENGK